MQIKQYTDLRHFYLLMKAKNEKVGTEWFIDDWFLWGGGFDYNGVFVHHIEGIK